MTKMTRLARIDEHSMRFLILATDVEGLTHLYQLRINTSSRNQVKARFEALATLEGWTPFEKVEVISLNTTRELEKLLVTDSLIEKE